MNRGAETALVWSFSLLVLGGFLGRGVFNVLAVLSIMLFVYLLSRSGETVRNRLVRDDLFRGWIVFVFSVFFANLFAVEWVHSMKKFAAFAFYGVSVTGIGLYLFRISETARENLDRALKAMILSAFFITFLMVLNIASGYDLIRYVSKGETVSYLGSYQFRFSVVVSLFFLPLYGLLRKDRYAAAAFLLFLESVSVLYSQSRTALVAFALSLAVGIVLYFPARLRMKILFGTLTLSLLGGGILYQVSPTVRARLQTFKTVFASHGDRMSGRLDLYEAAIGKIEKRPVTGYGVKSAIKHPISYRWKGIDVQSKHPHNVVLEILLDSGVIGILGLLYFFRVLAKEFSVRERREKAVVVSTLFCILLTSLSSWSVWSTNHLVVMLVILWVLSGVAAEEKRRLCGLSPE